MSHYKTSVIRRIYVADIPRDEDTDGCDESGFCHIVDAWNRPRSPAEVIEDIGAMKRFGLACLFFASFFLPLGLEGSLDGASIAIGLGILTLAVMALKTSLEKEKQLKTYVGNIAFITVAIARSR